MVTEYQMCTSGVAEVTVTLAMRPFLLYILFFRMQEISAQPPLVTQEDGELLQEKYILWETDLKEATSEERKIIIEGTQRLFAKCTIYQVRGHLLLYVPIQPLILAEEALQPSCLY